MSKEEDEIFHQAMSDWDEYKRHRALKALFQKGTRGCDVRHLNCVGRAFFWFKTLICLLLNRTNGSYLDVNSIYILAYDECSGGEGGSSWDGVWVGDKIFSKWEVCISCDGT